MNAVARKAFGSLLTVVDVKVHSRDLTDVTGQSIEEEHLRQRARVDKGRL